MVNYYLLNEAFKTGNAFSQFLIWYEISFPWLLIDYTRGCVVYGKGTLKCSDIRQILSNIQTTIC